MNMLNCVVFCLLMIVQSSIESDPMLTFTCDHNGVASINVDNLNKTYIIMNETEQIYCRPTAKTLSNCYSKTGNKTPKRSNQLTVVYEIEENVKLIGGKDSFLFNLTCDDGPRTLNASSSFKQTEHNKTHISKSEKVPWSEQLDLKISKDKDGSSKIDKDIDIGQQLFLVMSETESSKISPESCFAKPTNGDDADIVSMWKVTSDNTCNGNDPALIDQKWNKNKGKLFIQMYGFRFVKSDSVTVTCTALVCPGAVSSLCKQVCVNNDNSTATGRRRRDAIETSTHSHKSASVSFRVGTGVNTNRATGLTPSTVVYPFFLFLWFIWKESHKLF